MEYRPTIGLEIHAELKTSTKMFCSSKNDPDEKRPNVNICPVCMGHPGTLPVINKEAVAYVIAVGYAIGGEIADFTEFDRKNYFYPDIPKGYQISQYKYPLVNGGSVNGVAVTRVHLEEDTARSLHEPFGKSLVDFNRAGVPLMELVTEPVISSAEEAGNFAKELQILLRILGVSEANMEKGEMRVEANVSVSSSEENGTKVEVKNLNSFRAVVSAIDFEVKRQIETIARGGVVVQETRGWNENAGKTFSQRTKEQANDYRYFPEPDLPKLKISEVPEFLEMKNQLPELPWHKRQRYMEHFGLRKETADLFVSNISLARFFEEVTKELSEDKSLIQLAANYLSSDLIGLLMGNELPDFFTAKNFTELMRLAGRDELSSRGTKDVLALMLSDDRGPLIIAKENDLLQESSREKLVSIARKIVQDNDKVVVEYKSGKESALQFLVGQGMKESKGSANPQILAGIIKEVIGR